MSEHIILDIGTLVLGAILGSFINALSYRWGTGFSIVTGRSKCMRCGTTLSAIDLVPVFSWIFLRGRCRYCRTRISVQYPLVEALAALASLALYLTNPDPLVYAFSLVVAMTLLFIAVYDIRHTIIPWSASIFLIILALARLWGMGGIPLYDLLAGVILGAPLILIWALSRGRWMGLGDGILELSLGSYLGLTMGLTALFLAFWSGAAVGIALWALRRGVRMDSEVPLAPFLILGAAAAYILHVDFFPALPYLF